MRTQLTKALAAAVAAVGLAAAAAGARSQAPAQTPAQAPAAPAAAPAPAQADAPPADFQPKTPAEQAVAARVGEFVKAYEAADAQALSAIYTDDGVIVDADGLEARGREEIAQMYAAAFEETDGLKLEAHIESVKFLTPDVARVEGRSRLAAPAGDAAVYSRYSGLLVQKDGRWNLAELREYPAPLEDVEPYERLKDLEWMVGSWVNEGPRDKVTAEIKWAENRSYLIRTHSAEIEGEKRSAGTMFIGWDPQSGQIKSWLFDSEGGRGEGIWTRVDENQWVVRAQGVLRDGLPTSATQVHTILNKDSVKTDTVDRILGGMIAEDVVDVVMVRKAPAPGGEALPATK